MIEYLQNNIYLSILIGSIITIIHYLDNRNDKKTQSYKSYLKLLLISTVIIYLSLYLKNKFLDGKVFKSINKQQNLTGGALLNDQMQNVNIGEPDF